MESLRVRIEREIAKTDNPEQRAILLLQLGVMEYTAEGLRELASKLDNVLSNREDLQRRVLNGLAATHHEDHDWIADRRADDQMSQAVRAHVASRLQNDGYCDFAKRKIEEEKLSAEDARATKRKVIDVFIERVLGHIVSGLTAAAAVIAATLTLPK